MSSLPLCQGGKSMSQENLTPRTCTNYVEKKEYSYCQDCLLFFQQARPKCPTPGCDKHVKYSYARRKDLDTCVDHLSKFGPQCPFCPLLCMINSQTGLPFKTCHACRFKCPNFLSCGGTRGQSRLGYRYPVCPKCRYGEKFVQPKRDVSAVADDAAQVLDPIFFASADPFISTDPDEVD